MTKVIFYMYVMWQRKFGIILMKYCAESMSLIISFDSECAPNNLLHRAFPYRERITQLHGCLSEDVF